MPLRDQPIPAPPIANEWLSGLPRNKSLSQLQPPESAWSEGPRYIRNMGDDTPIRAYSLRDDYERNAEWYPTKTIRDWKTVDIHDEKNALPDAYPKAGIPIRPGAMKGNRMPKSEYNGLTMSPYEFDRSRG